MVPVTRQKASRAGTFGASDRALGASAEAVRVPEGQVVPCGGNLFAEVPGSDPINPGGPELTARRRDLGLRAAAALAHAAAALAPRRRGLGPDDYAPDSR